MTARTVEGVAWDDAALLEGGPSCFTPPPGSSNLLKRTRGGGCHGDDVSGGLGGNARPRGVNTPKRMNSIHWDPLGSRSFTSSSGIHSSCAIHAGATSGEGAAR